MYIIVNNTDNSFSKYEGSWPMDYIDGLLDKSNDIIVISLYSNTIKVPYGVDVINGITEYNWKEFKLPINVIAYYANLKKTIGS
jgi:hypothetical protein